MCRLASFFFLKIPTISGTNILGGVPEYRHVCICTIWWGVVPNITIAAVHHSCTGQCTMTLPLLYKCTIVPRVPVPVPGYICTTPVPGYICTSVHLYPGTRVPVGHLQLVLNSYGVSHCLAQADTVPTCNSASYSRYGKVILLFEIVRFFQVCLFCYHIYLYLHYIFDSILYLGHLSRSVRLAVSTLQLYPNARCVLLNLYAFMYKILLQIVSRSASNLRYDSTTQATVIQYRSLLGHLAYKL